MPMTPEDQKNWGFLERLTNRINKDVAASKKNILESSNPALGLLKCIGLLMFTVPFLPFLASTVGLIIVGSLCVVSVFSNAQQNEKKKKANKSMTETVRRQAAHTLNKITSTGIDTSRRHIAKGAKSIMVPMFALMAAVHFLMVYLPVKLSYPALSQNFFSPPALLLSAALTLFCTAAYFVRVHRKKNSTSEEAASCCFSRTSSDELSAAKASQFTKHASGKTPEYQAAVARRNARSEKAR
jgi:hypothetical protein